MGLLPAPVKAVLPAPAVTPVIPQPGELRLPISAVAMPPVVMVVAARMNALGQLPAGQTPARVIAWYPGATRLLYPIPAVNAIAVGVVPAGIIFVLIL